ncbi:hypothetical protein MLD38_019394 [Melastoma candidum]|uniref:Uncharacterized protein n=1 Tax=Melastoma candidum TaxID=119954 RepID=A0ACB9QWA8_9MYRT|nr:hypothetical protein MLD38_019394 [Melastoma candidum]
MKTTARASRFFLAAVVLFVSSEMRGIYPQDQGDYGGDVQAQPAAPPPVIDSCNGIFISYEFLSRTKEYPHVKNMTAQSWAFKSVATVLNTGTVDLNEWKLYVGFQHREMLVSADGGVLEDTDGFPASVGNGTYLTGYPQGDLLTSIETAGDLTQIQAAVQMKGTQFGVKPPGVPMPKTIRLENDGIKCPAPTRHGKYTMLKDPSRA